MIPVNYRVNVCGLDGVFAVSRLLWQPGRPVRYGNRTIPFALLSLRFLGVLPILLAFVCRRASSR